MTHTATLTRRRRPQTPTPKQQPNPRPKKTGSLLWPILFFILVGGGLMLIPSLFQKTMTVSECIREAVDEFPDINADGHLDIFLMENDTDIDHLLSEPEKHVGELLKILINPNSTEAEATLAYNTLYLMCDKGIIDACRALLVYQLDLKISAHNWIQIVQILLRIPADQLIILDEESMWEELKKYAESYELGTDHEILHTNSERLRRGLLMTRNILLMQYMQVRLKFKKSINKEMLRKVLRTNDGLPQNWSNPDSVKQMLDIEVQYTIELRIRAKFQKDLDHINRIKKRKNMGTNESLKRRNSLERRIREDIDWIIKEDPENADKAIETVLEVK